MKRAEIDEIVRHARYGTDCPVSGNFDEAVREAIAAGFKAGVREAESKPKGRCGACESEDTMLIRHCHQCGSDTADAVLMHANLEFARRGVAEPTEAMLQDGSRAYEAFLDGKQPRGRVYAEAMRAACRAMWGAPKTDKPFIPRPRGIAP